MEELKSLFDSYSRQARLFPALLTVLAPLVTALAWFPELLTSHIGSALLTVASSCGLLYALSSVARSRGKTVERRLLAQWGAWPTTYLLRHSSRLDPHTRGRYHVYFSTNVPGLTLPTPQAEARDPRAADLIYDSAIKWLKEKARKNSPLVDKENAQYGFRRNMRGMKAIALSGVIAALAASLLAVGLNVAQTADLASAQQVFVALRKAGNPAIWAAIAFNIVAAIAWFAVVTDDWVRSGGEQYAEAILATCDQ
ncbi:MULTISPECIES: hypothetical protein [unclassified Bradyrhizobium]|uniref:hypothetical protein n=1 Tax=unclassified Bradyrhizobium TaxID=2631580 RepID=UPI0028EB720E|nr:MULTISPECIES: hypothetical protein [unclassified Bradyrhizobium]